MRILVTGGSSMVGKQLQKILPSAVYLNSKDCDLINYEDTFSMFKKVKPNLVIHLAAKVGGIMDNINKPADFFDQNIIINTNTIKAAYRAGVPKLISILSTCIYPDKLKNNQYPLKENLLHAGPPTTTNFAYGYAKRCMAVQIEAYNKQFGTKYSSLIPSNLYCEYDHFEGDKAHFVSSLLNKINLAKTNKLDHIQLFGTGKPLRQFMYAGDLAKSIARVIDYNEPFTYNICPDENLSIKKIALTALKSCNASNLEIKWDTSKPDGQFRKDASSDEFLNKYSDFKFTPLSQGLKITYENKFSK